MAATRSQCTNTLRRRALPRRRLALLLTLAACSSEGAGDGALDVLVEAEDVIIHGLQPGDGIEDIRDGWAVDFDQYIAVLGGVQLHLSTDETVEAEAPEIYAIDLTKIPAAGASQWTLEGLAEGRYEFLYGLHGAGEAAQHESVDDADFAELQANDWTYLIAGAIEQVGGVSCPPASLASPPAGAVSAGMNRAGDTCYANPAISFRLGATAETSFGPCEIDGVPGVSVSAGTVVTVAVTIHGDHIFFNGFPEGDEGGVLRLAQWLADCDLDVDGVVTQAELAAIKPSDLVELDERYQLGGSPITPIESMWDYVRAQLKTQGHFQGEGECPIDGVAHEHGG